MKIAFRVDSSNVIGAGHLIRCLRLADDLRLKSKKIIFITKNFSGNFNNLINKKKYEVILIKDNDLNATKHICKKFSINVLIADSYYLGQNWEKKIRKHVDRLVVIDDFSKNKHYGDLIINNLSNKKHNKTKYLTGLKYIIIPKKRVKKRKIKKSKKILTVGTFFGSTDKVNFTEKLLKILSQEEFKKFKFVSILGKNNKNKKKIEKNFRKYKNLHIEKEFINMKYFFKKIDILITVGGVTFFEALSNNIKCICIPISYYQKTSCNFLKGRKISNILQHRDVLSGNGKNLLINSINKMTKKNFFMKRSIYIDGEGSKRIANYIFSSKFTKNINTNQVI